MKRSRERVSEIANRESPIANRGMHGQDAHATPPTFDHVFQLYRAHVNRGLASLVKFMGFEGVEWRGRGAVVWDGEGNEYLDCLGGFGVFALGHCPPRVVAAVREQLERLPLSSKVMLNPVQAELARLLAEITPGDLQYSFICNSGTEAVEGALKLARLATGRPGIVAAQGAFHGKTLGSLSASGRDVYRAPFQPLVPGFVHVPFGVAEALEQALSVETAAVLLEPIQGEAGVIIPPPGYLVRVREICRQRGVLLILDEVQTGLGRTGALFACQHEGVAPDIIALGKALGGGVMPVGAFVARPELWTHLEENPLLHSSTFGGNPLACAAGVAAIHAIREMNLPERAAELGEYLIGRLAQVQARHPETVSQVRGRGLLVGVEFSHPDLAGLAIAGLAQRRILAAYTLNNPSVIRLEPPLVIEPAQLDRAVEALEQSVAEAEGLLGKLC